MDAPRPEIVFGLISAFFLLCCCCLVVIAGGVGAFFFFRRSQPRPAAQMTIDAQPAAAPSSFVPTMGGSAPPPAETMVGSAPSPFMAPDLGEPTVTEIPEPPPPAAPIEADDIRAKLLALNGADKPYAVQATGYKIAIAPAEVTGYLLEISFDYAEKVARFVETNVAYAVPRLKQDARQVLEAEGWTVREQTA